MSLLSQRRLWQSVRQLPAFRCRLIIFDSRKWAQNIVQRKPPTQQPRSPCVVFVMSSVGISPEKRTLARLWTRQKMAKLMTDDLHTCIFTIADLSQPGSAAPDLCPSCVAPGPSPAAPPPLLLGMQQIVSLCNSILLIIENHIGKKKSTFRFVLKAT